MAKQKRATHGLWRRCLLSLLVGSGSAAATGSWEAVGPEAGMIRAFGFVPGSSELYGVVRGGGVFKSVDDGATWSAASDGITDWRLTAIAVVDETRAVVGTENGAFVTGDGGGHWSAAGLSGRRVNTLVRHPALAQTLFAGTDAGIYRSTDAGATWAAYGAGVAGDVRAIVFRPDDSNTVYAGLYDGGTYVCKSTDGGANWSGAGMGLMAPVLALYIDSAAPETLYASTQAFLQKSTNGGAFWTPVGGPPMLGRSGVARAPGNGHLIAADLLGVVYASADGGASWNTVTAIPAQETGAIAADPDGSFLYVGGTQGPYRTGNGSSWSLERSGLRAANVRVVITDQEADVLYAATDHDGLLRSTDAGISWSRVDDGSLYGPLALARDPVEPQVFYAGLQGDPGAGLKSVDGGAHWTTFGFAYAYVDWLRFAGDSLYAGYSTGMDFAFSRSSDGAAHWEGLYTGREFLDVLETADGELLAASEHGLLRRAADGGWSAVGSGITGLPLAVGEDRGGALYAATSTHVYRSSVDGANWVADLGGFTDGAVLAQDEANWSIYLAADGVYRRSAGAWSALPAGALGNRRVQHLALRAPIDYDVTLYAAAEQGGVFRYRVDTTPEPIAFAARSGVTKATLVESDDLQVTGVEIPVAVRVSGGEFSVDGGAWTSAPAWVSEGGALRLRLLSAATELTAIGMQVQVGPSLFTFTVTTAADPPDDPPPDDPPPDDPPPDDPPPDDPPPDDPPPDDPPPDDPPGSDTGAGGGGALLWLLPLLAALRGRQARAERDPFSAAVR